MVMRIPRILIAAPASGGGKTTVATGLMAALRATGRTVAPFKVGPDYIDPGYHSMASGRPGRNLDSVMCGDELMAPLLARGFVTPDAADIAVIEGVMGLFDGQLGTGRGSSAEIATSTQTPVVVVVDTAHASLTHAAVVAGLATFDPNVTIAGVILNPGRLSSSWCRGRARTRPTRHPGAGTDSAHRVDLRALSPPGPGPGGGVGGLRLQGRRPG